MRLRLFLSFALVALVSVIGVMVVARQNTTTAVRAFMYRGGMIGQGGLVQQLEDYYRVNRTWDGAEKLIETARRNRGQGMMGGNSAMMAQRLRLADSDGWFVADSSGADLQGKLSRVEKADSILLQVNGRTVGYLLAEGGMVFNLREERFLVNRLTNAALAAGLIALALSLLLSILLSYSLMRPVRELTGAARRLGEGDLSQRVNVKGGEELSVLGEALNRMADSLQKSQESRRSMTADIAHELRNPLAVQRANLEALQDGVYPLTPDALGPILDQNLLLTRLVDDLRTLALADAGELNLEKVAVDFGGLVEKLVERFRPQADLLHVNLRVERNTSADRPMIISADPFRVEQILKQSDLERAAIFAGWWRDYCEDHAWKG